MGISKTREHGFSVRRVQKRFTRQAFFTQRVVDIVRGSDRSDTIAMLKKHLDRHMNWQEWRQGELAQIAWGKRICSSAPPF